jgi:hypothetical protein
VLPRLRRAASVRRLVLSDVHVSALRRTGGAMIHAMLSVLAVMITAAVAFAALDYER